MYEPSPPIPLRVVSISKSTTCPATTLKLTILTSVSGDILALTVTGVVDNVPNDDASKSVSFGSGTATAAV